MKKAAALADRKKQREKNRAKEASENRSVEVSGMRRKSIALILTAAMVSGIFSAGSMEGTAEEAVIIEQTGSQEPEKTKTSNFTESGEETTEPETAESETTQSETTETESEGTMESTGETEAAELPETTLPEEAEEILSEPEMLIETADEPESETGETELLTETVETQGGDLVIEEISVLDTQELMANALQGGDSMENAIELKQYGLYDCILDEDTPLYFKVVPSISGMYTFEASQSSKPYNDFWGELLDETGKSLDLDDGINSEFGYYFSLQYYLEAGKSYYLKVTECNGDTRTFKLGYSSLFVDYDGTVTEPSVAYGGSLTLNTVASAHRGSRSLIAGAMREAQCSGAALRIRSQEQ